MAAINRAPFNALVDDDGTNTKGTIFGKTEIAGVILDPVDAAIAPLDAALPLKAPIASPAFTGTPTAPTAAPGVNTTQLATTAFVAVGVAGLAPLASPTFTGVPAAPTAAPGTSTTQLATTAFVQAASSGGTVSRTETATGNISALALPAGAGTLVIYMNNASLATIQGIAAGLNNQLLRIVSTGAAQVNLAHESASATAALRMVNFATSGPTPLAPGSGVAELQYDTASSRWRLVTHEQGAWITVPYVATNFNSNAGTWTVDAGDQLASAYHLRGRTLTWNLYLATTSVASAGIQLRAINPAGFQCAKQGGGAYHYADNAVQGVGLWESTPGVTLINFYTLTLGVWTNSANTSAIRATMVFEVN